MHLKTGTVTGMANTTIYEIAREAGCSAATVSRVINAYPYVKKATRDKVLKIIKEKGFVPNGTARSLVSQSTRMIGILISDIRTTQHTDGIYYIEQELSKEGYTSIICNTGSSSSSFEKYIEILALRSVEAVILMGSIYQSEEVKNAVTRYIPDIPVVLCNGSLEGDNIYSIITDEADGVYRAVKLLLEKGSLMPAFVYDRKTPSNLNKLEGYMKAVDESGLTPRILVVSPDEDIMKDELKSFLSDNPALDSIVFSEDYSALAALALFSRTGIKAPDDIAVISINNSRFARLGEITSLDNRLYETSITAVRTVLSLIKGESVNKKVLLFSELVERKTTG